jgi:polar amino acid transport system substrate-binding protein
MTGRGTRRGQRQAGVLNAGGFCIGAEEPLPSTFEEYTSSYVSPPTLLQVIDSFSPQPARMSGRAPGEHARCLTAVVVAALLAFAARTSGGTTLDRVQRNGLLNDALLTTYPPFGFINANNELDGFDVDVARAFAAKLGVKLKLVTPAWETVVSGQWRGRWDICICSMSPTAERAKVLNFPARYYSSPAVLVVHKDERRIRSVADISGKRVAVGMGSSYENYLNKTLVLAGQPPIVFPFHGVTAIPGDEAINFRNLALGPGVRLDAAISDLATARASIQSTNALRIVGPPLYAEPNAVATEQGDPEWDRTVARVFSELRAEGTLSRISRKWLGEDVTGDGP